MRFYHFIFLLAYIATTIQIVVSNNKIDGSLYPSYYSDTTKIKNEQIKSPENEYLPFGIITEKEASTKITEHFAGFVKKKVASAGDVINHNIYKKYYQTQSFFVYGKCNISKKHFLKLKTLLI